MRKWQLDLSSNPLANSKLQAEKFDWVTSYIRRIAGKERIQFNNAVFLSERETADRNYSMAYFMKENKCFPQDSDLYEVMDMYFQTCSMEVSTEALSVMGATLANGGETLETCVYGLFTMFQ